MDINQFSIRFDSEDACVKHLAKLRWPAGPVCDNCGETNRAWKRAEPRSWVCQACQHSFSVTAGTPLHKVKQPLPKVFMAVYLVAVSSKGISSVALAGQISVGQKTAWFLLQRIRQMMNRDKPVLRGIVEADETYIGGNGRQRGQMSKRDGTADQPKGRGGSRKMMAVTAVERGGKARARKGTTHSGHVIANALYAWLDREAVLVTDELPAYRWIGRKFRAHLRINHSKGEWVRRDPLATACAHTNTVESFNATIKRAILGVWHWFSIKHGDRYLSELSARWNFRQRGPMARVDSIFADLDGPALPWRELTA